MSARELAVKLAAEFTMVGTPEARVMRLERAILTAQAEAVEECERIALDEFMPSNAGTTRRIAGAIRAKARALRTAAEEVGR